MHRDDTIIGEVLAEVQKAIAKFPSWPTSIIDAGNVVSEEAGELAKACLQVTYEPHKETLEGVRMEAIQTAATCLRFLASMDRYDTKPRHQHKQPGLDLDSPCCTCEGRGWFASDMMGSSFEDCENCNGTGQIPMHIPHTGGDNDQG